MPGRGSDAGGVASTRPSGGGAAVLPGPRRSSPVLRTAALLEALLATAAVLADWFVPSLVLTGMAAVSLLLRRDRPSSLGLCRPRRPWLLARQMLGWAVLLTVLDVGLLIPLADHVSGRRQDTSAFADLQGNAALLGIYLVLGWTLAAFAEELAFRGYLLTRLGELLGGSRWAVALALLASSALFGVIHTEQGLVGMVLAGADACFFGGLRLWKGTLWAAVLAHGFDDTLGFVAFFLLGPVPPLW